LKDDTSPVVCAMPVDACVPWVTLDWVPSNEVGPGSSNGAELPGACISLLAPGRYPTGSEYMTLSAYDGGGASRSP